MLSHTCHQPVSGLAGLAGLRRAAAHRSGQPRHACRRRASHSHSHGSRGSVTAETAVLLPVLLVVLAAAIGVLVCLSAQLRCVDAARGAARAAARGDTPADVDATGRRLAPRGARVRVTASTDTVEVVVSTSVRPFGRALRLLPGVAVSARAVAAVEGPS